MNKFYKYVFVLGLLLSHCSLIFSQLGGQHSFEFLNLTQSSRVTALGGTLISVMDKDVTLAYRNPALLNKEMHAEISFNHNFHFAGISHGFVNTARHFEQLDMTFHVGVQYISYGDFSRSDEFGNINGEFSVGETAITIGTAKPLSNRMKMGINLKLAQSRFDTYNATGMAFDIGLNYYDQEKLIDVGFVLNNAGFALSQFTANGNSLPLNVQLGFSKRFQYLPFRLSITAHNLQQWNIRIEGENDNPVILFGQTQTGPSNLSKQIDNLFRHLVFSGEFLIGKAENFRIRLGYNHLRRKELALSEFRSLGGLHFGFGLKVSKFRFDYGLGHYHLAGATNHIGFSMNLNSWRKKL